MDNKRSILNLVISIIASLAAPFAIICIINEPTPMIKSLGIIVGITLLLMVVEMLIVGFSSYIENYPSLNAFAIGFGISFIAATVVLLSYSQPFWLGILMAVVIAIIDVIAYIGGFVLGSLIQYRE